MPRFYITETAIETHSVIADSAQEALVEYIRNGGKTESYEVTERTVYDDAHKACEVDEIAAENTAYKFLRE